MKVIVSPAHHCLFLDKSSLGVLKKYVVRRLTKKIPSTPGFKNTGFNVETDTQSSAD